MHFRSDSTSWVQIIFLLFACLPGLLYAAQPLRSIEVIVNSQSAKSDAQVVARLQAAGIKVDFYNLDAPKLLSKALSQDLPANPQAAQDQILQRWRRSGTHALVQRYQQAYQGLSKCLQYGLDRYPAMVFNQGEAVIYGITDLTQAVHLYQTGKRSP